MHERFLKTALEEAEKGRGECGPNPAVGAIVVRNNHVLARGFHRGAGLPHAEVEALRPLNDEARGATLYVTLEPCCHFGRTPPCTDLILQKGIAEVYFAEIDPNPKMAGAGAAALSRAGIVCHHVPVPEIQEFYESYRFWQEHKRPYVTAKLALTLDGKIAGPGGERRRITSPRLDHLTALYRKRSDAILTTARTVLRDNPRLNARLADNTITRAVYVLDRRVEFPSHAQLLSTAKSLTLFHSIEASAFELDRVRQLGVRTRPHMDLKQCLATIGEDGAHDLWVEAGGLLFESLLREKLIQKAIFYISPQWWGDNALPAFRRASSELFESAAAVRWNHLGDEAICEMVW